MVKRFENNHFLENTYVLYDDSRECAIIDPGMENASEVDTLFNFIEENYLQPKFILITHTHIDHIAGARYVCEKYHLPLTLHRDAIGILKQADIYCSTLQFTNTDLQNLDISTIDDTDILKFGNTEVEVRCVPGHAIGSLVFCVHQEKIVFSGDAIFKQSIGRTDLPTGDFNTLFHSLKTNILTLPDDYKILPGHGPETTVGDEKLYNPFIQ